MLGSDGKFIGQARWTKATTWGSRVESSTAVLAGHIMLVDVTISKERLGRAAPSARCVADRLRRAKCVTLHPNQGALDLNRLVSVVRDSNRYLSRRVDLSGKSELFRHRQGACDNPELSRRVTPVLCRR